MKTVQIDTEFIKLGQVLKLIGLAGSGVHAKVLIVGGEVKVNGIVELQRGKKIYKGDTVEFEGHVYKVV